MALSLLGSANFIRPGLRPNGPSNKRLAIATWEKGASRRAQGWAGENGDRSDRPCTHRKSQEQPSTSIGKRASLQNSLRRCSPGQSARLGVRGMGG